MTSRLICAAAFALAFSACGPQSAPASDGGAGPKAVAWDGRFDAGDRVRIKSRAGTFKPDETGHATDVNANPGRTGTVVRPIGELALIRFDPQTWDEFPPTGATVDLKEFEATIHTSFLQPAP